MSSFGAFYTYQPHTLAVMCYRRDQFAFVGRASWIVWKEHDRLLLDGLTLIFTQIIWQEFDQTKKKKKKKKKKKNNNSNNNNNTSFKDDQLSVSMGFILGLIESYGKVVNSKMLIVFV